MIADTLRKAFQDNTENEDIISDVIATITLAITQESRERQRMYTENDYVCTLLNSYIINNWPSKNIIPEIVMPYYTFRIVLPVLMEYYSKMNESLYRIN